MDMCKIYADLAYKNFEVSIEKHGELARLMDKTGFYFFSKGNFDLAISYLNNAISLGDNAVLHANKALCLRLSGKYDEALSECEKALSLDSNSSSAYYNKACILSVKGDLKDAIYNLLKALELEDGVFDQAKEESNLALLDISKTQNKEDLKKVLTNKLSEISSKL
jgi:tetratricopeptide (TPR) repeat protein